MLSSKTMATPYRTPEARADEPRERELVVHLEEPSLLDKIFRREPRGTTRLLVNEGVLGVVFHDGRPNFRGELREILAVSLETDSIDKGQAQVGPDGRVGAGFTSLPVDVSRIVLIVADRRAPIALSEARIAHMVAVEWLGKIRVFLRSEGWLPDDERPAPASLRDEPDTD